MNKFRNIKASEVEVRIGTCSEKGVSLLLYKDARVDMGILDETVGPENWQCDYYEHKGTLFCKVGIRCDDEWVWKADAGSPSNMEAQKGEASDAFKRACFRWGIGRELYTAPFVWVGAGNLAKHKVGKNGRWQCFDEFSVLDMSVSEGAITGLAIRNNTNSRIVYTYAAGGQQKQVKGRFAKVTELKAEALSLGIKEEGIKAWIDATFKGKPMAGFTDEQVKAVEDYLATLIRDKKALDG